MSGTMTISGVDKSDFEIRRTLFACFLTFRPLINTQYSVLSLCNEFNKAKQLISPHEFMLIMKKGHLYVGNSRSERSKSCILSYIANIGWSVLKNDKRREFIVDGHDRGFVFVMKDFNLFPSDKVKNELLHDIKNGKYFEGNFVSQLYVVSS